MNHRTFLIALTLIAAVALVVGATDEGPTATAPSRPMRGGRFGGGSRPQGPKRLTSERVTELLAKMEAEQPEVHERLVRLRGADERGFMRAMVGVDRFVRRLAELPEPVREAMRQQHRDRLARHRLLRQYRQAEDAGAREELRGAIRDVVAGMFDTDQILKKHKVEQLTQELEALKRELADRVDRRDVLIEQTLERLLAAEPTPRP